MTPSVFIVGAPLAATLLEKSVSSNNVTKGGQKGDKKMGKGGGQMREHMGGISSRFLSELVQLVGQHMFQGPILHASVPK